MDSSVITCDEMINAEAMSCNEETKRVKKSLMKKIQKICKTQNFYTLLAFLLIITALLIAVSIYSYLIKYRAKKKIFNIISCHKWWIKKCIINMDSVDELK